MLKTDLAPVEAVRAIRALAERHQSYRVGSGISLVASQNRVSPEVLEMLGSSFAAKFSSGERGRRAHAGAAWLDEMEAIVEGLAARLLAPWHVELRPPAGSIANESLMLALLRPGDAIISPGQLAGGHASLRPEGMAGMMGVKVHDLPFAADGFTIDLDALEALIRRVGPRIVAVGTAKLLRSYPVAEIVRLAEMSGARVIFDAAHVAGLIAGGAFPDPLRDGAVAYTGSTQKTFPGPVGGLIVAADPDLYDRIRAVTRLRLDNYQNNRVAAMGVVFAEMLSFGAELAQAVVETARALGRALAAEGLRVEGEAFGYTHTHLVLVDTDGFDRDGTLNRRLEAAGLFTTAVPLWPRAGAASPRTGLRIGANDIARLGFGTEAVGRLAALIADIVLDRRPGEAVAGDVADLGRQHAAIDRRFRLAL